MAIRRVRRSMRKVRYEKRPGIIKTVIKAGTYVYSLYFLYKIFGTIPKYIGIVFLIIGFVQMKNIILCIQTITEKYRHLATNIREVDSLDGIEFEHYLCAHFEKKGYKVQLTPPSNDYGVDLIVSKGKDRIAVQAKRYNVDKGYTVNYKAVQEVSAGKAFYGCNKGMVVTNSFFTDQAKELAKANKIDMWDRERMIKEFQIIGAPKKDTYRKGNTELPTYDFVIESA